MDIKKDKIASMSKEDVDLFVAQALQQINRRRPVRRSFNYDLEFLPEFLKKKNEQKPVPQ